MSEVKKTSEELALDAILNQVGEFEKILGDSAKKEELDAVKSTVEEFKNELATLTNAKLVEGMQKINDANEKLFKQVLELQEKKAQEKEVGSVSQRKAKEELTRKEVEQFVKELFPGGVGSEKVRKHITLTLKEDTVELFGAMTFDDESDATAYTGRAIDPTLYKKARKTNIITDHFDMQSIDVPSLIYLRKIEEAVDSKDEPIDFGGADWIACGDKKPLRSFRLGTGTAEAKKVAIFTTVPDCLLQDVPSFLTWLREDFATEMREEFNRGLLKGNPSVTPTEPLGLLTNAVQFSATPAFTNSVFAPTYIDGIIAIAAKFADSRENLDKVFVSSDVYYSILALKGSDQRYNNAANIYTNNLGQLYISGVEVISVDKEDVPSTHILAIGVDNGFKIRPYGGQSFETGLNGDDFREDKTSFRAWQRVITYIPEERENSVMYDTWANILAAIDSPENPYCCPKDDGGDGGDGGTQN